MQTENNSKCHHDHDYDDNDILINLSKKRLKQLQKHVTAEVFIIIQVSYDHMHHSAFVLLAGQHLACRTVLLQHSLKVLLPRTWLIRRLVGWLVGV